MFAGFTFTSNVGSNFWIESCSDLNVGTGVGTALLIDRDGMPHPMVGADVGRRRRFRRINQDKRKIAESLVEKIVVGENEIDITFSYLPSSEEVCKNQQKLGAG